MDGSKPVHDKSTPQLLEELDHLNVTIQKYDISIYQLMEQRARLVMSAHEVYSQVRQNEDINLDGNTTTHDITTNH